MTIAPVPARALLAAALLVPVLAPAQQPPTPAPPQPAASAPARGNERVEITGGRESDTDQRRQSTAAKIVIGREELDKFGDATVGEVLRRLPGVTTPGAPGRGGPPRLRGLGGGYTQLLIDGQRVPPGFSLESLSPEQLERIEILRAPTAETGARAIAGTINIVTREGFRRRLNDLRLGFGFENDRASPGISWTRNDSVDDFIYNVSVSLFHPRRLTEGGSQTITADRDTGQVLEQTAFTQTADERRTGLALTSRLQWRLGEAGDSLVLMPTLFANEAETRRRFTQTRLVPALPPLAANGVYDFGDGQTDSTFRNARLNANWRQRILGGPRLELNGNVGQWRSENETSRHEFLAGDVAPARSTLDRGTARENSGSLTLKLSGLLGGAGGAAGPGAGPNPASGAGPNPASGAGPRAGPGADPGAGPRAGPGAGAGREHSLVAGLELETVERRENRTLVDGTRVVGAEFGDTFTARTLRSAAYVQDEWNLDAHWAFHAGLRWEGIRTEGDAGASAAEPNPVNRTSVWTPLVHLLWKPDPRKRDQIRLSLTRAYKSPGTQQLIARPSINSRFPETGPNDPTSPDSAGNPGLRPELSTGVDLAFERYLEGGGVLSANLFRRDIRDLIRSVVTLETVSWSPVPRWVSRPRNIGKAVTQGLELEAKYRLDQLIAGAPGIELRHNLALYRSEVDGIPGPDNRLDEQARLTANLGADYRLRGTPLTLGGNLNLVPGYRTQVAADRAVTVASKRVFDVFALWTFNPQVGLRVLANNLAPRDYDNTNTFDYAIGPTALRETAVSSGPSYTNWQLRLELKL